MRRPAFRLLAPGAAALALALAAASLSAQSPGSDLPEHPEVVGIEFDGVRGVPVGVLRDAIYTEPSRCRSRLLTPLCWITDSRSVTRKAYLDRLELRRDVLRIRVIYWRYGYRHALVDTAVTPRKNGVRVRFSVSEGPPTVVQLDTVIGAEEVLRARDVSRSVQLRSGDPLNLADLDSSLINLRNTMWELGYADAEIFPQITIEPAPPAPLGTQPDTVPSASLRINIDPRYVTRVGEITIEGNERVETNVIRNSLIMRPGDLFRRSTVTESQRRLYESNLFSRVQIEVPPPGDSIKAIRIEVDEAPLRNVRAAAGFSTRDFIQTDARFVHYNWLGGARRLELRGTVGNLLAEQLQNRWLFQHPTNLLTAAERDQFLTPSWQASAELAQPWAFGNVRNSLGASAFGHRRIIPGVVVDRSIGAGASFTREVQLRLPITFQYRYEVNNIEAGSVYFCVNFGVCERNTIDALRGGRTMAPLWLSGFDDHADDALNPTAGHLARLDLEHASGVTLSDFQYNRLAGDISRYIPVNRATLALRLRGGYVRALAGTSRRVGMDTDGTPVVHPRKRFYAGGSQSVRGYQENQLGPRILTIDPSRLLDTLPGRPNCTMSEIELGVCDPTGIDSREFVPRPLGGNSLIEGSVEYRFPFRWENFSIAVFLDGAFVGQGSLEDIVEGTGALTPGFGFRYLSPVGPIRVDLGIRPTIEEWMPVITEVTDPDGRGRLVRLNEQKRFNPVGRDGGFLRQVGERLTLHLAIGQAF